MQLLISPWRIGFARPVRGRRPTWHPSERGGGVRRVAERAVIVMAAAVLWAGAGSALLTSTAAAGGVDSGSGLLSAAVYNLSPYPMTLVASGTPSGGGWSTAPGNIAPGGASGYALNPWKAEGGGICIGDYRSHFDAYMTYRVDVLGGPVEYVTVAITGAGRTRPPPASATSPRATWIPGSACSSRARRRPGASTRTTGASPGPATSGPAAHLPAQRPVPVRPDCRGRRQLDGRRDVAARPRARRRAELHLRRDQPQLRLHAGRRPDVGARRAGVTRPVAELRGRQLGRRRRVTSRSITRRRRRPP